MRDSVLFVGQNTIPSSDSLEEFIGIVDVLCTQTCVVSLLGLLRAVTGGLKDAYSGQGGCVASSSLEYLEIHPLFPQTPQSPKRQETQPHSEDDKDKDKDKEKEKDKKEKDKSKSKTKRKPVNIPARPPSALAAHSWNSGHTKEPVQETPPSPWYKLTNGALSPPRHVSAFQPETSYLKKATIPTIPTLPSSQPVAIVAPQPKKSPSSASDWPTSLPETGTSPPSSGSGSGGSTCSGGSDGPESPQHQRGGNSKFPSMGIGQILKKRVVPPFTFRPEQAVEVESPMPYHMQTLLCSSGKALKTLC